MSTVSGQRRTVVGPAPTELHLPASFPAASTTAVSDPATVNAPPAFTATAPLGAGGPGGAGGQLLDGLVQPAATRPSRTRCGWSPTGTDTTFLPVAKSMAVTWSVPLSETTQALPSPLTVAQ